MSAAPTQPSAIGRLNLAGRISLAAFGAALVALSLRLWPEWRHNPDLSHGLFMPMVFAILIHEGRGGTPRFLRPGPWSRAGLVALLAGGLLSLVTAGLYAAAVDWSHALVNLMLTLSCTLLLGAGLLVFSGERVRLLPFNWPAVVAVVAWLLTAPIPPGTYTRLTLTLQLWVSEGVLRTLHLLGIAAVRHGNIIDLARTSVGVEEACSGIRSLISCVFAGLFFSATLVRRPWARVLILALSAPLALLMNFLRSLALTLLANHGVDIAGTWHDVTGFAVLGVTAAMLGGLAVLLERGRPRAPEAAATASAEPAGGAPQWALAGTLLSALVLVTIFVTNTRPSIRRDAPVPNLFALIPGSVDGWQVKTTDLYEFRGTLKTEHLAQRSYARVAGGQPTEVIIYLAYWRAGQAPVSLVASHTPDACWPGAGWVPQPTAQARTPLQADQRALPEAEYRKFQLGERPQHVWFWHLYDGQPIAYRDPYSPLELLRIALKYGFRHDGDQLFVRVSSNRPWDQIAAEPLLAEFFARTRAIGL